MINLFGAGKLIFPTKKITIETDIKTKIILFIFTISILILFVGKINFPAPNKLIKQEIPRENLKIVK